MLYLRSQLWLGLEGGGSVAHTAGVIGGLAARPASTSRSCPPTACPASRRRPTSWRPRRGSTAGCAKLEDLAYNVAFFVAALRAARRTRPQAIYQRHTAFNCSRRAAVARAAACRWCSNSTAPRCGRAATGAACAWSRAAALVERINLQAADRVVVVSRVLRDSSWPRACRPTKSWSTRTPSTPTSFSPDVDGARDQTPPGHRGVERRRRLLGHVRRCGTAFRRWLQALPRVLAARPQVRWLLIGDGPLRHLVDDAVDQQRARRSRAACPAWCRTPRCRPTWPRATSWSRRTGARPTAASSSARRPSCSSTWPPGGRSSPAPSARSPTCSRTSAPRCWCRPTTPRRSAERDRAPGRRRLSAGAARPGGAPGRRRAPHLAPERRARCWPSSRRAMSTSSVSEVVYRLRRVPPRRLPLVVGPLRAGASPARERGAGTSSTTAASCPMPPCAARSGSTSAEAGLCRTSCERFFVDPAEAAQRARRARRSAPRSSPSERARPPSRRSTTSSTCSARVRSRSATASTGTATSKSASPGRATSWPTTRTTCAWASRATSRCPGS